MAGLNDKDMRSLEAPGDRFLALVGMKLATVARGFKRDRQERQKHRSTAPSAEDVDRQLWDVKSNPQKQAIESDADETLYGGSAGSGKTALLLILATRYHRRSVIFRREYPNLKEIIERSRELLGGLAKYNSNDKLWRGIPGDRTLEFGAMQYEQNKEGYRGRPHDLKAYDEVTEFSEDQYVFTSGWCRTTIKDQRCRVIATCNPPSSQSGRWVIRRWAPWLDVNHLNPAEPGELRWFAMLKDENGTFKDTEVESSEPFEKDGEIIQPRSRTFIPGRLEDNIYLKDTGYRAVLQNMPEPLRSQMLYGDFSIGDVDDAWQMIPSVWVRAAMSRWNDRSPFGYEVLGVDVARGGGDQTIIAGRYLFWVDKLRVFPGAVTPNGGAVADLVIQSMPNLNVPVHIDVVGVGASPYDELRRRGVNARGINGGAKVVDEYGEPLRDRTGQLGFFNFRSYMWWNIRELLDPVHGGSLDLPNDENLFGDLTSVRWSVVPVKEPTTGLKGLIKAESKDDVKKRLGRSTDHGDAVCYAFADAKDDNAGAADWLIQAASYRPEDEQFY